MAATTIDAIPTTNPDPFAGAAAPTAGPLARAGVACRAPFTGLQFHAAGGLGEVYRATNTALNREEALKFLKARYADDSDSRRRFGQEAEITGRLEHPGIVPVYAIGADGRGQPCYAMRFIRGETLDEAIRRFHDADTAGGRDPDERRESFRALLKRFVSVCNTIGYAHSRGIVHRDVKPKNVMLGRYDETLVVDWGLAKPTGQASGSTADGDREPEVTPRPGLGDPEAATRGLVGTPGFMSPEAAEALVARGLVLAGTGRLVEAEAGWERALALSREPDGGSAEAEGGDRPALAIEGKALYCLGLAATIRGRPDEAEKSYRAALDLQSRSSAGPESPPGATLALRMTQLNLGGLLLNRGKAEEGESLIGAALAGLDALADRPGATAADHATAAEQSYQYASSRFGAGVVSGLRPTIESAVRHARAAALARPEGEADRRRLAQALEGLVYIASAEREGPAAAEAAREWLDGGPTVVADLVEVAARLAAVDGDAACRSQALRAIGRAVELRMPNPEKLADDPRFQALFATEEARARLRPPVAPD